jgi:hypothetical protein
VLSCVGAVLSYVGAQKSSKTAQINPKLTPKQLKTAQNSSKQLTTAPT